MYNFKGPAKSWSPLNIFYINFNTSIRKQLSAMTDTCAGIKGRNLMNFI